MAFATIYLAKAVGAFDDENLDVEIVNIPTNDAIAPLSQGRIDVLVSSMSAAILNAIGSGLDLRWVAPLYQNNPDALDGVYATSEFFDSNGSFDWARMEGATIGLQGTAPSVIHYLFSKYLDEAGVEFSDINFQALGSAEILVALESGAIDMGALSDPYWREVQGDDRFGRVGDLPTGIASMVLAGPTFNDRPEVAAAFFRALHRTIVEYLQPHNINSEQSIAALVDALQLEPDQIRTEYPLLFDATFSMDPAREVVEGMQELFFEMDGVLTYPAPLPVDEIISTDAIEAALSCFQ